MLLERNNLTNDTKNVEKIDLHFISVQYKRFVFCLSI
jgi:hypothetical protein